VPTAAELLSPHSLSRKPPFDHRRVDGRVPRNVLSDTIFRFGSACRYCCYPRVPRCGPPLPTRSVRRNDKNNKCDRRRTSTGVRTSKSFLS
jgi:hypothetical protein